MPQRLALPQYLRQLPDPSIPNLVDVQVEVNQGLALSQHPRQPQQQQGQPQQGPQTSYPASPDEPAPCILQALSSASPFPLYAPIRSEIKCRWVSTLHRNSPSTFASLLVLIPSAAIPLLFKSR
eukprot:3937612-Rhodomonas_salina.1